MAESIRSPIYVDANPFIYAVEGDDAIARPVVELFGILRRRPGSAVTSELTLAEVLPKAHKPQYRKAYFDLMVWSAIFELVPVSRNILIATADFRRGFAHATSDRRSAMPRLPDAIHVVTAIRSGCRVVLSSDLRIKLPDEIRLIDATPASITSLVQELA